MGGVRRGWCKKHQWFNPLDDVKNSSCKVCEALCFGFKPTGSLEGEVGDGSNCADSVKIKIVASDPAKFGSARLVLHENFVSGGGPSSYAHVDMFTIYVCGSLSEKVLKELKSLGCKITAFENAEGETSEVMQTIRVSVGGEVLEFKLDRFAPVISVASKSGLVAVNLYDENEFLLSTLTNHT